MLSYYADMPFLALPYDNDEREAFMATYQVLQNTCRPNTGCWGPWC